MRSVAAVVLAVATLPCLAQEPDRAALERFWQAERGDVLAAPALAPEGAPGAGPDGQLACPVHGAAMHLTDLEAGTEVAVCSAGWEVWVRTGGDAPAWRGPFEVVGGTGPARPAVDRKTVEDALMQHITDSGDQGFYANRFANVEELGPGAVEHLFAIYTSSADDQMRYLAIEALGEVAGKDSIPELQRLGKDPKNSAHLLSISIALYRLGDTSLVDRMFEEYEAQLAEDSDPKRQSSVHSEMAIVLTKCGKEDESLEHYQKAVELDPSNRIAAYNLACGYSKLGRVDDGLAALETSLQAGFDEWEWMMVDADLAKVREDPRFKALFDKYRK